MLNNNSAYNSTTSRFQEVSLTQKVKVTMPDDFLDKVKYLCKSIADVEWSGILFYAVNGTIKEPGNMEVVLKDILPMDKGTSVFTEYNLDERFVAYLMDNPEAMNLKVGHIHSHNTMGVFFSGTDTDELHDNSPNYDFYLSLIVNNYMDFKAKIATIGHAKVESIVAPYIATDEEGKQYNIDQGKFFVDVKRVYTYDCEIVSSVEQITIPDYFKQGVENILKVKKSLPVVHKNFGGGKSWQKKPKTSGKKGKKKANTPLTPDEILHEQYQQMADVYCGELFPDMSDIELFVMALFNFTANMDINDSIDIILTELTELDMDDHEIALKIVESCVDIYAAFFPDRNTEDFVTDLEEAIQILEEEEIVYPFLTKSKEGLMNLIQNVVKDERVTTIE